MDLNDGRKHSVLFSWGKYHVFIFEYAPSWELRYCWKTSWSRVSFFNTLVAFAKYTARTCLQVIQVFSSNTLSLKNLQWQKLAFPKITYCSSEMDNWNISRQKSLVEYWVILHFSKMSVASFSGSPKYE